MLMQSAWTEWTGWGEKAMALVRAGAAESNEIANAFRQVNAVELTDECRRLAGRAPNFLERLTIKDKPGFYATRLEGARRELQALLGRIEALKAQAAPLFETLQLDALAMGALAAEQTEAVRAAAADGRWRVLVNGYASGVSLIAMLNDNQLAIVGAIGNIDQLLNDVIPNWAQAVSRL